MNLSQPPKMQKMDKVHSRSKVAISFVGLIITQLANNYSTGSLISSTISTGLFSNRNNPKLSLNLAYQSDMFIVTCLGGRASPVHLQIYHSKRQDENDPLWMVHFPISFSFYISLFFKIQAFSLDEGRATMLCALMVPQSEPN